MRLRAASLLLVTMLATAGWRATNTYAQGATPEPKPQPNALLVYDKTAVALVNTSTATIPMFGVDFWRAGGAAKFSAINIASKLNAGECWQVWTTDVNGVLGQPPDCNLRVRWQKLRQNVNYFWVGDTDTEIFRPRLFGSALTICLAAGKEAGRCTFRIPQGDEAKKAWVVQDPATGVAMPANIRVAYDANQMWIGNFTADTVLPTANLRLFYPANNKEVVWTPDKGTWDIGAWDNRGLQPNECIVLSKDASTVKALLPCKAVAHATLTDQPWQTKFDVMGPREDRRATCGTGAPVKGPVLCLIGG